MLIFFFRKHAFINKDSWLSSKTITQMQLYLYQSDFLLYILWKATEYSSMQEEFNKEKIWWHCVLKERRVSLINPWHPKSRDPRIQESRLGCPLETFCCVLHFSNQILDNSNNPVYPPVNTWTCYFAPLFCQISLSELNIKSKRMLQHCSCRLI